ncbi:zinc finger, CCHC-type containing protein [Tanacetum coccineum]
MKRDEALDKFKVFKTEVELQQGSQIKRFRTDRGGKRGIECIFVGYAEHSKAFRFYVIELSDSISRIRDKVSDQHSYCFNVEDDPKTFDEAMKSQDVAFWKEAINDEMDSIMGNNTWVLADLPPGCKPLGCKWIFKIKLKVDGTIEKFKARLVIYSFKQKSGIDYFDTYALVTRISTIRLLVAMTSIHNLIIHQMDVKIAFLNGDLDEEVDLNFYLSSRFSMKDMREADVILGIRIKHESNEIAICQSHYIKKVLKKFNYFGCTLVSTPIDTSEKLMPNNGQAVSQHEYSRWVLKYLKKTMDYRLTNTGYPSVLEGYTDASWINNTEDNSSTSGWVFLLSTGAISWASKKQTCITGSTMEYEIVALEAAAPISIRCDSAATLAKAYSQMYNGKSRHLGVRHSMIRELIMNGVISIEFVRSQQNLADHLTKGLARDLVIKSAKGMQCQEQMKNDTVCKEKVSNVFQKEREQYLEIQDLKAQLQDKNIAINSLERKSFTQTQSVTKTNVSESLSKPVTTQILPPKARQDVRNTNVIKPGMYRIDTRTTQTRAPQLPQTSRNTNPRVSTSTGVIHKTNVSRPQLRSTQMKDKVVPSNSHVKDKKTEVEDHHRISSTSNKTKSVTASNDSLKSRTSNVNVVCATCGKCVFNSNHDACVSKYLNDVNARTKKHKVVPISTRKPKSQANKSVATPHKKTVASETTTQKSKSYYRMLYEKTSKAWKRL